MIKLKDLMTLERILLEIDVRFKFKLDFGNALKLYNYLKEVGRITSYAFLLQDEFHKKFGDIEKLKEYHNEIMKNEIEFDCTDIEKFIDYVYMIHGDEEFVNIVSEIKFWK